MNKKKGKNRKKKTGSHYFMPMLPCDKGVSIDIIYVIIAYSISLYTFNFVSIVIKMCIMNYILLLYSEVFCYFIWLCRISQTVKIPLERIGKAVVRLIVPNIATQRSIAYFPYNFNENIKQKQKEKLSFDKMLYWN